MALTDTHYIHISSLGLQFVANKDISNYSDMLSNDGDILLIFNYKMKNIG